MFKFNLQPVLSLKQKIEDSKKRALGEATMRKEGIQNEKCLLEQKRQQALLEARTMDQSMVNIEGIKAFNHYDQYMSGAIKEKDHELNEAKKVVSEKRHELLEAVKDRKILDNLKAIHKEIFDEEEKRGEQRILDDMVTYRFGVKGKE